MHFSVARLAIAVTIRPVVLLPEYIKRPRLAATEIIHDRSRVCSSDRDREAKSNTAGTTAPVQYDLVEAIIAAA